jgi:hypothetical protein
MSASWHFTTDDKGLIQLQARFKEPIGEASYTNPDPTKKKTGKT